MTENYTLKENPEDFIVEEVSNVKFNEKGNYFIYELKKINISMFDILKKIGLKEVGYAGIKDKRAITTQLISTNKKINDIKENNYELKYIGRSIDPISLGDLIGNNFEIRVSNYEKEILPGKYFMINYYDDQRFSKYNIEIGKSLILKDFKKCVELIKLSNNSEVNEMQEVLAYASSDYVSAIKKLPKKLLMLYVHSYQSYLWNKIVSLNYKDEKQIEVSFGKLNVPINKPKQIKIEIPGFGLKDDKITEDILKSEKITERDFIIKQIPQISCEAIERDVVIEYDLEIKDNKLKFFLPKGSYATMAIKQLLS